MYHLIACNWQHLLPIIVHAVPMTVLGMRQLGLLLNAKAKWARENEYGIIVCQIWIFFQDGSENIAKNSNISLPDYLIFGLHITLITHKAVVYNMII
jgi:hypothetical protein